MRAERCEELFSSFRGFMFFLFFSMPPSRTRIMSSRISVGFLLFEIPIRIFLKMGNLKENKITVFLAKQLDSNAY